MRESKGEDVCWREGRWEYFIGTDNGTVRNDITMGGKYKDFGGGVWEIV